MQHAMMQMPINSSIDHNHVLGCLFTVKIHII
jgi:hypothetical protein